MKSPKGFTLLEVLVTLAIMGLILALVPPLFSNVIDSTRLKSATRLLASSLQQARSQAISKQRESLLMLDVENRRYAVDDKQYRLDLPPDTQLSLIAANTEQLSDQQAGIRFFPDGSSTGGRIELSNDRNEYLIDVNWLTGKIQISP